MSTPTRIRRLPRLHAQERGRGGSLSARAYIELKQRILGAHYIPGHFLQEARLCIELGFGRTPVRQALQRLHQEQFVEIIPRKGAFVKGVSLADTLVALEARLLVEPYCAMQAALSATDDELASVQDLHRAFSGARSGGERRILMAIDKAIHGRLAELSRNPLLCDLLRPIHERMSRIWFLPHWQYSDFGTTADEHDAIVAALLNREPEEAMRAMREHLEALRARIILGAGGKFDATGVMPVRKV